MTVYEINSDCKQDFFGSLNLYFLILPILHVSVAQSSKHYVEILVLTFFMKAKYLNLFQTFLLDCVQLAFYFVGFFQLLCVFWWR
jgi:hypothetical protein